jgi:hypothetical protein
VSCVGSLRHLPSLLVAGPLVAGPPVAAATREAAVVEEALVTLQRTLRWTRWQPSMLLQS